MFMFKLYKFPLAMPKKSKYTTMLNKESIAFLQVRGNCCSNDSNKSGLSRDINEALQKLINTQIEAQRQAAQDYLGIALGFLDLGTSKPGTGGFFMMKYQEGLDHAQDFLQYLTLRYGNPTISAIKQMKFDKNLSQYQAFTRALEIEWNLAEMAENIVLEANAKEDYECADFVDAYLDDQMKSICEMQKHMTRFFRFASAHGCYHYDLELAKAYPNKYKKKPYVFLYC